MALPLASQFQDIFHFSDCCFTSYIPCALLDQRHSYLRVSAVHVRQDSWLNGSRSAALFVLFQDMFATKFLSFTAIKHYFYRGYICLHSDTFWQGCLMLANNASSPVSPQVKRVKLKFALRLLSNMPLQANNSACTAATGLIKRCPHQIQNLVKYRGSKYAVGNQWHDTMGQLKVPVCWGEASLHTMQHWNRKFSL